MNTTISYPAALVQLGLDRGWIKPAPMRRNHISEGATQKTLTPVRRWQKTNPQKVQQYRKRAYRKRADRFLAIGLTVDGNPRQRMRHERPELNGLKGKQRHTRYMQLWRAEKEHGKAGAART